MEVKRVGIISEKRFKRTKVTDYSEWQPSLFSFDVGYNFFLLSGESLTVMCCQLVLSYWGQSLLAKPLK
jgi:hypothetical protein